MTIGETSVFEVKRGAVHVSGSCVVLEEVMDTKAVRLVVGYCLKPGEKVRRISEEEYAVEY